MKCPHCNYVDGYDAENNHPDPGQQGDFYRLPVKMEREDPHSYYGSIENVPVLACPSCRKMFIGDKW